MIGRKNIYEQIDLNLVKNPKDFVVLNRYSVSEAPCLIGANISCSVGIAEGTKGIMAGIVWNEVDNAPDISTLPFGKVNSVPCLVYPFPSWKSYNTTRTT